MPRRPAPTALRLVQGPLPPRGHPKHTLPSPPHPAFSSLKGPHIMVKVKTSPEPRVPLRSTTMPQERVPVASHHFSVRQHPDPFLVSPVRQGSPRGRLDEHSPECDLRLGMASLPPSTSSTKFTRGPWDHTRSVSLPFNVESLLAVPKPVAVSP